MHGATIKVFVRFWHVSASQRKSFSAPGLIILSKIVIITAVHLK